MGIKSIFRTHPGTFYLPLYIKFCLPSFLKYSEFSELYDPYTRAREEIFINNRKELKTNYLFIKNFVSTSINYQTSVKSVKSYCVI